MTLRQLDGNLQLPAPQWPLEVWYDSVRDREFAQFDVEDLARACRQRTELTHLLPFALDKLQVNPLAGEMYDGELFSALKGLPSEFWASNENLHDRLVSIAKSACDESGDDLFRLDITTNALPRDNSTDDWIP